MTPQASICWGRCGELLGLWGSVGLHQEQRGSAGPGKGLLLLCSVQGSWVASGEWPCGEPLEWCEGGCEVGRKSMESPGP